MSVTPFKIKFPNNYDWNLKMRKFENVFKTETLKMSKGLMEKGDNTGYWLYDETRGMNLGMRAHSERDAFIEALEYYQQRLRQVEMENKNMLSRIESFLGSLQEIGIEPDVTCDFCQSYR